MINKRVKTKTYKIQKTIKASPQQMIIKKKPITRIQQQTIVQQDKSREDIKIGRTLLQNKDKRINKRITMPKINSYTKRIGNGRIEILRRTKRID